MEQTIQIILKLLEVNKEYLYSREIDFITLCFGLDDGKPRTLQEVGDIVGITPERVRQIADRTIHSCAQARRRKPIRDFYAKD